VKKSTPLPTPPSRLISVQVYDRVPITNMRRIPYDEAPLSMRLRWPRPQHTLKDMCEAVRWMATGHE